VIEPPIVQIDSIREQIPYAGMVYVSVDKTGVVSVKLMNVSHVECQFASTCYAWLSSSYDSRHSRHSLSQLQLVSAPISDCMDDQKALTRK
jgi:hypothetical protein